LACAEPLQAAASSQDGRIVPVAGVKTTCSIEMAALLSVLRRWCPISWLEAWHMAVCDHAQRPPQYGPW
jgi:hypothetical protein